MAYTVLHKCHELNAEQWGRLSDNFHAVQEAVASGDMKRAAATKKNLRRAHSSLFRPSGYDENETVLAGLPGTIATRIAAAHGRRRSDDKFGPAPKSTLHPALRGKYGSSVPSAPARMPGFADPVAQRLFTVFLESLEAQRTAMTKSARAETSLPAARRDNSEGAANEAQGAIAIMQEDPRAATPAGVRREAEPADPDNQYVELDQEALPLVDISRYGTPILNPGGGDCLFHALAGRELARDDLVKLRGRVADVRRGMPEQEGWNAIRLAAALTQTPNLRAHAMDMIDGLHAIPNEVLANFQAVPGMYAGDDEIAQWLSLEENRGKRVVVVPSRNLAYGFTDANSGTHTIAIDALDEEVKQADVLLQRQGLHWERIKKNRKYSNAQPYLNLFVAARRGIR